MLIKNSKFINTPILLIFLITIIFSGNQIPTAQAQASPQTEPLIQSGDITLLGSFSVPAGTADAFSYGGMALALSADGTSLYYGGNIQNETIGRISIPALGGTATIIQNPTSIPGNTGGENATEVAGALVYNNRLIVTKRNKYSTTNFNPVTVGNLSIGGFLSQMQSVAGADGHFVSGYMGLIPSEWQSLLGGPAFIGNGVMSINSQDTNGPSFYVFNPDNVGVVNPIPATNLMSFPYGQNCNTCLANPDVANDLFSRSNYYNAGIVFPSGTRSVLFFHRQGYGPPTYKQDDGCSGSGGEGAAPYRRQIDAYDANDLLAVKNGTKQPYQIRPYAWWVLPGVVDSCASFSGGTDGGYDLAYDQASRKIYIEIGQGDTRKVYEFQVANLSNTPTPPPTPPSPSPTPTVGDINLDHIVNSIDYSILNAHWFTNDSTSDLNHDGIVNAIDYSMLNANWFKTW